MIKSFLSAVGLSLNSFTIILTIVIAVVMLVVMYRYWINFYKKQDLITRYFSRISNMYKAKHRNDISIYCSIV